MDIRPGTQIGRYKIQSLLGTGGIGQVYLAQDTQLNRTIALKVLPSDVASDKQRMRRFVQEARAASSLNHPNILTIYEFGQTNSIHFIAAEFIDGETVRKRITNARLKRNEAIFSGDLGEINKVTTADVILAWEVFQRFDDKGWGFTDCTSKVVMEQRGVTVAFALDRHFRQFGTIQVVP